MVSLNEHLANPRLRCGIVLGVREDACDVQFGGQLHSVRYATQFPSPRTERVSPGHLVAIAISSGRPTMVVWRWYDAVLLGRQDGLIRLWEPAHGEVLAQPGPSYRDVPAGSRAYLSAGLPGADWWVAGPVMATAEEAEVELDAVENLSIEYGLLT